MLPFYLAAMTSMDTEEIKAVTLKIEALKKKYPELELVDVTNDDQHMASQP